MVTSLRYVALSLLLLIVLGARVRAQEAPVDPASLTAEQAAAVAQRAQLAGRNYAGDCGAADASSAGAVCSVVFAQVGGVLARYFVIADDGSVSASEFDELLLPAPTPVPMPDPAAAATSPSANGDSVSFVFDPGVTAQDQADIRQGVSIGQQAFGPSGDITVSAFTDLEALLHAYSAAVCGGCPQSADVRQRWQSSPGEAVANFVFIYTSTDGWRNPTYDAHTSHLEIAAQEYFHTVQNFLSRQNVFTSCGDCPYAAGPVWLIAGGAQYEAFTALSAAGLYSYADARQRFLAQAWTVSLPLDQLETWGPARAAHVERPSYGLSALAVEYLSGIAGAPSIEHYWTVLAGSSSWQSAFQSTFGMSIADFYSRFETYRQSQLAPPAPTLTFVGQVPVSTVARFSPNGTLYELRLTGVNGVLGDTAVRVLSSSGAVVSTAWARQGAERLFVYLLRGALTGSYTVVVTVPNGPTLSATFSTAGG